MNILAFDTATPSGGAALMRDERLCGVVAINAARQHSAECLDLASRLIEAEGLAWEDIDVFACGRGPGSFTGVRIAMTLAKTLAFSKQKQLVTVCSMQAMAAHAPAGEKCDATLVLLDARRGELYAALYGAGPDGWREVIIPPACVAPDALPAFLGEHASRALLACGEGALVAGVLPNETTPWGHVTLARADRRFASPASVALLAREAALRGEFVEVKSAVPVYLRAALG